MPIIIAALAVFLVLVVGTVVTNSWILPKSNNATRMLITALLLITTFYAGSRAVVFRNVHMDSIRCASNLRTLAPYYYRYEDDHGQFPKTILDLANSYPDIEGRYLTCTASGLSYECSQSRPSEIGSSDIPLMWCPHPHNAFRTLFGHQSSEVGRWVEFSKSGRKFLSEDEFAKMKGEQVH